mmetsp:Transcript_4733/g.11273  ORF Transcript_4733/g.11273 Transcript_4733/m.11273 type:complete len:255 (+) Transcript_4733:296-1060(+)
MVHLGNFGDPPINDELLHLHAAQLLHRVRARHSRLHLHLARLHFDRRILHHHLHDRLWDSPSVSPVGKQLLHERGLLAVHALKAQVCDSAHERHRFPCHRSLLHRARRHHLWREGAGSDPSGPSRSNLPSPQAGKAPEGPGSDREDVQEELEILSIHIVCDLLDSDHHCKSHLLCRERSDLRDRVQMRWGIACLQQLHGHHLLRRLHRLVDRLLRPHRRIQQQVLRNRQPIIRSQCKLSRPYSLPTGWSLLGRW